MEFYYLFNGNMRMSELEKPDLYNQNVEGQTDGVKFLLFNRASQQAIGKVSAVLVG